MLLTGHKAMEEWASMSKAAMDAFVDLKQNNSYHQTNSLHIEDIDILIFNES